MRKWRGRSKAKAGCCTYCPSELFARQLISVHLLQNRIVLWVADFGVDRLDAVIVLLQRCVVLFAEPRYIGKHILELEHFFAKNK
jgi:hypothetical protein